MRESKVEIIIECKKCKSNLLINQKTFNVSKKKFVKEWSNSKFYDITAICPKCRTANELKEIAIIDNTFIFR